MREPCSVGIASVLLLSTSCTSVTPPSLAPPQPDSRAGNTDAHQGPPEIVSIVAGTPTDVYALVARGAHRCWFGADGLLKPTHVFHAEAEPPTQGGAAEIVIHERDEAFRDKRGARALRVTFATAPAGARVGVAVLKMEPQLGQVMAADVAAWANGGTDCELRKHVPPPQHPEAVVSKVDARSGKKR